MNHRVPAILALTAAISAACSPAQAQQSVTDPASGLGVTLPPGYQSQAGVRPNADASFGLSPASGFPPVAGTSPHVCAVEFKASQSNQGMTQAEINTGIRGKAWTDTARTILSNVFDISNARHDTRNGVMRYQFDARPKLGPGHENVRLLGTIMETPKGRTSIFCGTTRAAWPKAKPTFHVIAAGVTPP